MTDPNKCETAWAASVYYAEIMVNASLEQAWPLMLNYQSWNPSFIDAQVTIVGGDHGKEGEVVLIKKSIRDAAGKPWPQFIAETAKLVHQRHIVWYIYPKDGNEFRNFVDFSLTGISDGVRFSIAYYAQNRLSGQPLLAQRSEMEKALRDLTLSFKGYCEANA